MSTLNAIDSVTGARERIGDLLRDGIHHVTYQILDVLGYGTYGSIYLAKTIPTVPGMLPVYKAIKCLSKKGLTQTQLLLQRQEIDLHLSLSSPTNGQHPHIVDMSSVIETKDSLYLAMEYCSGGDLYDTITSQHSAARDSGVDLAPMANFPGRCLDVHSDSSVVDAMTQIISALVHSHSHQVFHRDLKPENILVASDGSLKLADFGLATKERVSNDFGCGSSFYMAPEQQPTRSSVGRRPYLPAKSDVWSLGIIFLNLRFGRNPWKLSRVDMDATFAAYAQNSDVLREMFPELSPSALHFLKRVLCVDPNDRADSYEALELIQRVHTIVGHEPSANDFASMEECNEERIDSDLMLDDSSIGSSRSSVHGSASSCYEVDEEEDEIDSMFRMEDDYGARLSGHVTVSRTRSCSSSWSLASSHKSGKSWSDMIEEDEMDFSLPVEFEEADPTSTVPSDDVEAAGENFSSDNGAAANSFTNGASENAKNNSNNNNSKNSNNPTITTNNNNHPDDSDNDYTSSTFIHSFACYDHQYFSQHLYQQPLHHTSNDFRAPPHPSWFSSATWIYNELDQELVQTGFAKLSELAFPGTPVPGLSSSSPLAKVVPLGMFSFEDDGLLTNPP
ncbi:hypothetical protein BG015_000951 [Linnemannia schmuckeri]|uniref:Protein kinase domain-containing protein n=1 Tax=Linnemannia schmuckeri TaxID=64567 RepID=A0A9P5RQV0_9FUNG|nr:hypothetical protein BG015_000951 [Linnemannia schmuckeri]